MKFFVGQAVFPLYIFGMSQRSSKRDSSEKKNEISIRIMSCAKVRCCNSRSQLHRNKPSLC